MELKTFKFGELDAALLTAFWDSFIADYSCFSGPKLLSSEHEFPKQHITRFRDGWFQKRRDQLTTDHLSKPLSPGWACSEPLVNFQCTFFSMLQKSSSLKDLAFVRHLLDWQFKLLKSSIDFSWEFVHLSIFPILSLSLCWISDRGFVTILS